MRHYSLTFCILATLLGISNISQAQVIQILKTKGNVYAAKGNKKVKLKSGLKLKGPLEVFSSKKSFAIIKTQNQDKITLGPDSKIFITQKSNSDPSLVSLVKGKIRAKVRKRNNNKHKLYIKTKSAALGVRGTDFILTYNEKNHITSNITLQGEVDFYKETDAEILNSIKEELDTNPKDKNKYSNYTEIEDKLSANTVSIKKGNFSGAFPTYDVPLNPTKVSSQQLQALSRTNFVKEKTSNVIKNKDKRNFKLTNKNLIPEPKGNIEKQIRNSHRHKLAKNSVRAGGVVDLDTGIYVMPPKGAKYDSEKGEYILPEQYGGIDSSTGSYVPPSNTKLDPYLGFVSFVDGTMKQIDEFGTSVNKLLDKYKKLTRVDLEADARYFYSYKSYEDYYGEYRYVSNAESMVLSFEGFVGRHIYNSQRYMHYLKAGMEMIWHNRRDEPFVQRNDRLLSMYGYEFHFKHHFLERKANLVFDLKFNTIYQDFNNKDQWDFYTENTRLDLYERFNFAKNHQIEFGPFAQAFQGFRDNDHGNIYGITLSYIYDKHLHSKIKITNHLSRRYNKVDGDIIDINIFSAAYTFKSLFRKTDLTLGYEYQALNSDQNLYINTSHYNDWKISLERRKGEHLVFNAFYEYLENNSSGGPENRDFLQQLWGAGVKFKF
ncbi:MAG: FecR domain-containing protein [Oligoflexia bacterium]|nr:FecR domain-containing protein [Oligoflexia bacterium]